MTPHTFHITRHMVIAVGTGLFAVAVAFAVKGTPGLAVLLPAALLIVLARRTRLQLDERGIHSRGIFPSDTWSLPWDQSLGVSVDRVRATSGGGGDSAASTELRLQFMRRDDRPLQLTGYEHRTCSAVLEAFRARNLDAIDHMQDER